MRLQNAPRPAKGRSNSLDVERMMFASISWAHPRSILIGKADLPPRRASLDFSHSSRLLTLPPPRLQTQREHSKWPIGWTS